MATGLLPVVVLNTRVILVSGYLFCSVTVIVFSERLIPLGCKAGFHPQGRVKGRLEVTAKVLPNETVEALVQE